MGRTKGWLVSFSKALGEEDIGQIMNLFGEESYWRDLLAFTWNIQTMESRDEIVLMLEENIGRVRPAGWEITGPESNKPSIVGAPFKFETSVAWCRGFFWLKGDKCFTFMTSMWELKGYEEYVARRRSLGVTIGSVPGRRSWGQERKQEKSELGEVKQPYCLIVGGGQSGLMLAARLKVLEVPTLVVEKSARLGDAWHTRYDSLVFHTPSFSDGFPYLSYPSNWPLLPSKEKMGNWIDCYSKIMELNAWCSAECKSASYIEKNDHWKVEVVRKSDDGVSTVTLYPTHLVIACGYTGHPVVPKLKGAETFEGEQMHSSRYKQGKDWKGKKAIVVGTGNSGHDICLDLWEQGASEVTMIQRSPSIVLKVATLVASRKDPELNGKELDSDYDADSADIKTASIPFKAMFPMLVQACRGLDVTEADFQENLKKVGFRLHWGEDGTGVGGSVFQRAGGFFLDMGLSELIINGHVKVKNGLQEIKESSVVFSDGSESPADLIVYATGYGNIRDHLDTIISKEVGRKLDVVGE